MRHLQSRQLVTIWLVFAVIMANLSSIFVPSVSAAEQDSFLTVEEALQQEHGTEITMRGYIVEGFNGEYAVRVADSVEAAGPSMIVKLESDMREMFSPDNNPAALHQEIIVTGVRDVYSGLESIESVSGIAFTGEVPTEPEQPAELVSIADARNESDGRSVIVEGIVLADVAAIGGGQYSTYIQDETGGINVFAFEQGGLPVLEKGDKIRVTGELETYRGLKEIVPTSVEVVAEGQPVPDAQPVTLADLQTSDTAEVYEGELVELTGYISNIPDSPAGGGYNISLIDEAYNGTTLRVMEGALDVAELEEGSWYNVTAIVSQYDSYQLLPTGAGDLTLAAEQPEAPTAAGEYTSTVLSVTDGDTIRLETPVLGADRVRFLNIDTPETDMGSANGAHGENQDRHGEAASAYLKTLLQPGDEVTLRVGEEATDDYGRLPAQVINEEGVNTNLEMVRRGYASSYFIWPVGDEAVYQEFQAAVRAAKNEQLGIWNPEDPLLELPFEYRAILEGGDFHRYVGNSETMEYVEPLEWEQVPVDKRIFFNEEAEAIAQGYTPAGSGEQPQEPDGDNLAVQLLSMNDLHGKIDQEYELDITGDGNNDGMFGRMDYLSAYLKDRTEENPNTLLLHAGDMIGGSSPVSGLFQDEPTVEILEEIGFDVGTVGNHEFDEGTEELLRMVHGGEHPEGKGTAGYDGMNLDLLCANCIDRETNQPILPPYTVLETGGAQIGFIGVNTEASASMVMAEGIENIRFTDETAAVNAAAAELKAQGIEAIVVLAHLPASQTDAGITGESAELARNVDDEVDIIYAAHNHQVVNGLVDEKLIVQASEYGKAFSDVDLQIDPETGDIVQKEAEIVYVDQAGVEPDAAVTEILEKYQALIAPKMNQVLGYNASDLTGDYSNDGDHGLGNLIADSMKDAMDSDFAIMNGGGIRDDLLAGEITWGDLYNILPFDNTLMTFEVQGADLYPILNAQLSPQYGPDYSVSGFHYTWDSNTNQVVDITLPDGTPIDENATYTLTANNFMGTSTGDKYLPISQLGENPVMGPVDVDALVDFVVSLETSEQSPLRYEAEGRIAEAASEPGEELGEVTIQEARQAEAGTVVTVSGIVTTAPGAWGSSGFYLQDETAGTYVYGDDSVAVGDVITLTAETGAYNGEFQLSNITNVEITGTSELPAAIEVTPAQIDETNQGQLVTVKGAVISGLEKVNDYGTFEFQAEKDGESILVRVDNRTGLAFDGFTFENGDVVDITGISSTFNGTFQLKPAKPEDIVEHVVAEEPDEEDGHPGKGHHYGHDKHDKKDKQKHLKPDKKMKQKKHDKQNKQKNGEPVEKAS